MSRGLPLAFHLEAECDVEVRDERTVATSDEPWLRLEHVPRTWVDRLIEIEYRASLLDEPVRPIFRFQRDDGSVVDRIGAAPIAGAGVWTGRVPTGTTGISISPTNRPGPFSFLIEGVRLCSWLALLARGFRFHPRAARSALLTRLIGWNPESDVNLTWAISAAPMINYASWQKARARAFDLHGLDRPRFEWSAASTIKVVVLGEAKDEIKRTLSSLVAQAFPFWQAVILADIDRDAIDDARIRKASPCELPACVSSGAGDELICVLRCGDILAPHALAYVADQARRHLARRIFYSDVMLATDDGATIPRFHPGWSPRLQATTSYIDHLLFVRGRFLGQGLGDFLGSGKLPISFTSNLSCREVMALRRILATSKKRDTVVGQPPSIAVRATARATIIIPTRDHPALLRRILASIRARSTPGTFEIVVVDNGSTTSAAQDLLAELGQAPDIICRDRPGKFEFSAICNEAAAAATAEVLVFLNDDTEVLSDGWLDRLVTHAMDPGIGAVGAKLTYPDGRLQHVGVLVGMGESAGHLGARGAGDSAGWANRNQALHEVSAVTGACLAVERRKFEAVGGFDAENLPVELSDVDLCLRLNARGWQTLVDPAVHLLHEESASRGGATFRRLDVYERERAFFVERWRHVLRDDPFFHPGLSLYSVQAALG